MDDTTQRGTYSLAEAVTGLRRSTLQSMADPPQAPRPHEGVLGGAGAGDAGLRRLPPGTESVRADSELVAAQGMESSASTILKRTFSPFICEKGIRRSC